jgi:hypothetical protein
MVASGGQMRFLAGKVEPMTLRTINKVLKGVAVAAVALTSTVFQAGGCSINVTGMDSVIEGLVSDLGGSDLFGGTDSFSTTDSFSSGSSYSSTPYSYAPVQTGGYWGYSPWY